MRLDMDMLWNALLAHAGNNVEIALYGDPENPADVCLEDTDTNEVILDAELYTLAPREKKVPDPEIVGFVIKHGEDDYSIWNGDLSAGEQKIVQSIARSHVNDGSSVRGDASLLEGGDQK